VVPGGSAVNFCLQLKELGLSPAFIGMIGDDATGVSLRDLLEKGGISSYLICTAAQTNISFNMTNPAGKHIMLVAGTANAILSPEAVVPKLQESLPGARYLYLGGFFKLKSFRKAFSEIAGLSKTSDTKLVVDHGRIPKGVLPEMAEAVKALVLQSACYFPSRDEFCQLWEVDSIDAGLQLLWQKAPGLVAVVKDGANGAYYFADNDVRHVAASPVTKVVNATGAGDTFNAGLIAALAKGQNLAEAVAYGCAVAAKKISQH
jgi:sugar/nucleoside kinase (ribokinase family)